MPTEKQLDDKTCCALAQFRAFNSTKPKELRAVIAARKDAGYRALMVITKAEETKTEKRLVKLKFEHISTFNRRVCYEQTPLKMWLLKL